MLKVGTEVLSSLRSKIPTEQHHRLRSTVLLQPCDKPTWPGFINLAISILTFDKKTKMK